jgi:hypothetical protein
VAATVLGGAYVLATVVRWTILKVVKGVTLDRFLSDSGLSSIFNHSGRLRGATVLAGTCYWTILVIGFLTAVDVFDTTLTSRIVEATVFAIPKLVTAGAILLAGFWLAKYLGRSTLVWAVNEEIRMARRLAMAVRIVVVFVAVVVAADALEFARPVFFAAFVIVLAAAALAAGIAGGLALSRYFEERLSRGREDPSDREERALWNHL